MSTGDGGVGYFAPGATDDWLYGSRGVPSYTFEIGPDSGPLRRLLPRLHLHDLNLLAQQKPALRYAAQAAATPYGPFPNHPPIPPTVAPSRPRIAVLISNNLS
ncbi:hypothetical protein EV648_102253 [Kribbella sp. VKM Ac-2568]|nr:hypothetical protein EV648_102253 [Kribbella sp. VKM Ac-2568]